MPGKLRVSLSHNRDDSPLSQRSLYSLALTLSPSSLLSLYSSAADELFFFFLTLLKPPDIARSTPALLLIIRQKAACASPHWPLVFVVDARYALWFAETLRFPVPNSTPEAFALLEQSSVMPPAQPAASAQCDQRY